MTSQMLPLAFASKIGVYNIPFGDLLVKVHIIQHLTLLVQKLTILGVLYKHAGIDAQYWRCLDLVFTLHSYSINALESYAFLISNILEMFISSIHIAFTFNKCTRIICI